MGHDHSAIVIDSDKHFTIDPVTRAIATESPKLTVMQYDHNSERFTFEIPKVIEGHDMTLCNLVRIHYQNQGSGGNKSNVYEVKDLQTSEAGADTLLFSWLISGDCTKFAGTLSFAVRFYCTLDDGTIDYSWGTAIFNSVTVSNGMENVEQVIADNSDLIVQIQSEVEELRNGMKPKDIVVNISGDAESGYTADKTFAQIRQLIDDGHDVKVKCPDVTILLGIYSNSSYIINFQLYQGLSFWNADITRNDKVSYSRGITTANEWGIGGVMADPKTDGDTIPARIGEDDKLYVDAQPRNLVVTVENKGDHYEASHSSIEIQEARSAGKDVYVMHEGYMYEYYAELFTNVIFQRQFGMVERQVIIDETSECSFPEKFPNVSEKTEEDTDYTIEVKIDPETGKLYVPSAINQVI